jgi:hypothetical protein
MMEPEVSHGVTAAKCMFVRNLSEIPVPHASLSNSERLVKTPRDLASTNLFLKPIAGEFKYLSVVVRSNSMRT